MWHPLPFPCILAFCHGRWGSCVIPRWLCKVFSTISCQQNCFPVPMATGFAEHLLPSDIRSQGYKQSQTAFSLVVHLSLQMLEIAVVISVGCLWIRLEWWFCNSITFFTTVAEGGQIFMRLLLFSFMLPCCCVFLWQVVFFSLQVLSGDVGEDAEVHAAKLMEVILLQCSGKVDHVSKLFS